MELYDLDKLVRDKNQDNLYDMFIPTFRNSGLGVSTPVEVNEEKMMRLDLVSFEAYRTDDYIDIICGINYLDNPLNVMEGDVLLCPSGDDISSYRLDDVGRESSLAQVNKTEQPNFVDENRKNYVSQNFNISPTSLPEPKDPLKFEGDNIIISK